MENEFVNVLVPTTTSFASGFVAVTVTDVTSHGAGAPGFAASHCALVRMSTATSVDESA